MEELKVAIDRLTTASVSTSNIADHIDDGLRAFGADVDSLLTNWRGLSAEHFGEAWTEWREGADIVVSSLRATAAQLIDSANGYDNSESTTTDHVGRLKL